MYGQYTCDGLTTGDMEACYNGTIKCTGVGKKSPLWMCNAIAGQLYSLKDYCNPNISGTNYTLGLSGQTFSCSCD